MDKDKLPPDPALVSRTLLDTIVSEADDSPVFRCSLRERLDIIANLFSRDIRGILRNCQAPKTYFNSDTEAQEALRNYLNLSEKSDETWRISNTKSGAKRQSSLSPLVEETSSKQRTQNRPTSSASITDVLDEPNLANSANLQANSALSLAATLRNVNDGLNYTVSALAEATGLLQLVMRAEQPSKERIMESLSRIQLACSATQGLQIGLKACVDVLSLLGTVDTMCGPEQAATPLKTPIKGKTANVTSYASAMKSNRQSSNSKRSFSQDKLTRMKMAEERKKIRCDSRSIRLKPQSINGIINNGILVREICRFLNFKGPERDLIEEVRVDRRGCYYCQVKETFFKETLTRTWKVSEPVESLSVGKKPIVIYGVSSHIQPQEFATELWESNYHRWGLNSSEKMSDHIAHPNPPYFIKCGGRVPGFNVFLPCVDPHEIKCALLVDETLGVSGTFSKSGRVVGTTLKVKGVCQEISLIYTYIQPGTSVGWDSLRDFSRKILETPGAMVVIGGDFNAHSSMWGPLGVAEDSNGKRLIEWSDDHDLFILNKWPCLPTFLNLLGQNSWIDVSLVSALAKNLVHNWTVLDNQVKITDHNTIEFQIKLSDPLYEIESFPNFRKTDWSMFSVKLHFILKQEGWLDFKWEEISTNDTLDSKIQELEACIKTVIDDLVPSSMRLTKRRLWWNSELQN
eukprot:g7348.t1